jgi:prepilin-type N-terminal cleavage/methylation domain-containing protein
MQNLRKTKKGFTLIEILIVVAIIGILATIVIVSLREASDRGRNTKIVAGVVQVRKIAEDMYLQEATGYEGLCLNDGTGGVGSNIDMQTIEADIGQFGRSLDCYSEQYHYCVSVELMGENANYFCIDDNGNNIESASTPCAANHISCE